MLLVNLHVYYQFLCACQLSFEQTCQILTFEVEIVSLVSPCNITSVRTRVTSVRENQ